MRSCQNWSPFLCERILGSYTINTNTELGKCLAITLDPNLLFLEHLNCKNNPAISIFTDESKIGPVGNVGAAFHSPELGTSKSVGINKNASIYTAESIAIKLTLESVSDIYDRNVYIYTDSLSVVSALQSLLLGARTNPYLVILILLEDRVIASPAAISRIYFFWIPSHIGILGNEMADRLVKEDTHYKPSPLLFIPLTDLFILFLHQTRNCTIKKIKNLVQSKGTNYFNIYYCESPKPWFSKKHLSRDFIIWINRCRCNHYHLRSSLVRIGLVNDSTCTCRFPDQTLDHIIW
ncbi:uncharacterized protein LOC105429625 [Pogonomyrmex barbatus]|uniref:Uncharacterized protein LOC105429625 n=1 Tax=Pogonomyrmex barbatus TaxID=144034 RepID=A0A6I9X8V4_9HYME|nr:uncharacterized protein LOC105429625 [Pogonomyrmex barbatus]